jgi:putative flavoprotein involved in K+ transport
VIRNPRATVPERTDVLIVGGGQAGLAVSYYLTLANIAHLVLDADPRTGDSWRRRWDSLELFSVADYSALPGLRFPGDPERFPAKDEVADYLEGYAHKFGLPIRHGTRVRSLGSSNGRYQLDSESGAFESAHVVVATGAYQIPSVPDFAEKLSPDVVQMHSGGYRNPAQLAAGRILVVGTANSGAQIAADLSRNHDVILSRGQKIGRLPKRILGKGLHWYGDHLGLIAAPLDSWRGGTQRHDILIGAGLRQLERRHGVTLVSRTVDATDQSVTLADGQGLDVEAIVWATGYHSDYSWIRVPVFDERGAPVHRRGVTLASGLFFLGMHNQYSRGSSLIGFVSHDASFISERICDTVVPRR